MSRWKCALALNDERAIVGGSEAELAQAIGNGADLRIHTEFAHNDHIDVRSENAEIVREVAQFGVTYLIDKQWSAGIMSLRQPVDLPNGFGPNPSMSFFLYNQDGHQAIARPYLDGRVTMGQPGPSQVSGPNDMPKYHQGTTWDEDTNAPSHNFIYDFELFRYLVAEPWQEVLAHDADGQVQSGSVEALGTAFSDGCAVKVGISGLCADLAGQETALEHEVFVETGSNYYYTKAKLFIAGSHPVVRIRPGMPLGYESRGWDFGWLVLRSDGGVAYRRCDPYTLGFNDVEIKLAMRWFVS
jgi:hypothetical protein